MGREEEGDTPSRLWASGPAPPQWGGLSRQKRASAEPVPAPSPPRAGPSQAACTFLSPMLVPLGLQGRTGRALGSAGSDLVPGLADTWAQHPGGNSLLFILSKSLSQLDF